MAYGSSIGKNTWVLKNSKQLHFWGKKTKFLICGGLQSVTNLFCKIGGAFSRRKAHVLEYWGFKENYLQFFFQNCLVLVFEKLKKIFGINFCLAKIGLENFKKKNWGFSKKIKSKNVLTIVVVGKNGVLGLMLAYCGICLYDGIFPKNFGNWVLVVAKREIFG